jgi:hypothetical protein
MGLFDVIVGPHLAQQSPMPTFVQTTAIAGMAFLLAQAALGIFTGVGLLRLRNWARISALVWAGITVPFALLIVFIMLLVPLPVPPRPEAPAHLMLFLRFFLVLFYGIPLGVGIWWLILFTRKGVTVCGADGRRRGPPRGSFLRTTVSRADQGAPPRHRTCVVLLNLFPKRRLRLFNAYARSTVRFCHPRSSRNGYLRNLVLVVCRLGHRFAAGAALGLLACPWAANSWTRERHHNSAQPQVRSHPARKLVLDGPFSSLQRKLRRDPRAFVRIYWFARSDRHAGDASVLPAAIPPSQQWPPSWVAAIVARWPLGLPPDGRYGILCISAPLVGFSVPERVQIRED